MPTAKNSVTRDPFVVVANNLGRFASDQAYATTYATRLPTHACRRVTMPRRRRFTNRFRKVPNAASTMQHCITAYGTYGALSCRNKALAATLSYIFDKGESRNRTPPGTIIAKWLFCLAMQLTLVNEELHFAHFQVDMCDGIPHGRDS